jgi:hypothetical protein
VDLGYLFLRSCNFFFKKFGEFSIFFVFCFVLFGLNLGLDWETSWEMNDFDHSLYRLFSDKRMSKLA